MIPSGADMKSDEYMVPGNYYCQTDTEAASLINCPANRAFVLKVDYATGTSYPRQIFRVRNNKIFARTYDIATGSWQPDIEYAEKSDFYPINISKQSLMTIRKSGWYMGSQISELTNKGISTAIWFNIFATYQEDKIWSFIFLGLDGSRYTGMIRGESGTLEYFKNF